MILEKGDMWDTWGEVELFMVTAGNFVKRGDILVMESGIAKQAAEQFPALQSQAGTLIREYTRVYQTSNYVALTPKYVHENYDQLVMNGWPTQGLSTMGLFQVKEFFGATDNIGLVQAGVRKLIELILDHDITSVVLDYPGAGGELPRDWVLPVIEQLPDVVHVWEQGNHVSL